MLVDAFYGDVMVGRWDEQPESTRILALLGDGDASLSSVHEGKEALLVVASSPI